MVKVLQKSADDLNELHPPHQGLLKPAEFYANFELHSYHSALELKPFVMYIWTQRWDMPEEIPYDSTSEIFTGPNIQLFFTKDEAFIHGIQTVGFDYKVSGQSGVIAGIKFKPGGFYPFWHRPVSTLTERKVSLSLLFPEITDRFSKKLLAGNDQAIVADLNALLCRYLPPPDGTVELIEEILWAMKTEPSLTTVSAVAKHFKRSERNLQDIFHTYVGVGLKWVFMRNRLLQAAEYARRVDKPNWLQLSHELGYSSQPHFVADFKRTLGMTPSEYIRAVH